MNGTTFALLVLLLSLLIPVAVAGGVIVFMVRSRRPHEGVREWVRKATSEGGLSMVKTAPKRATDQHGRPLNLNDVLVHAPQTHDNAANLSDLEHYIYHRDRGASESGSLLGSTVVTKVGPPPQKTITKSARKPAKNIATKYRKKKNPKVQPEPTLPVAGGSNSGPRPPAPPVPPAAMISSKSSSATPVPDSSVGSSPIPEAMSPAERNSPAPTNPAAFPRVSPSAGRNLTADRQMQSEAPDLLGRASLPDDLRGPAPDSPMNQQVPIWTPVSTAGSPMTPAESPSLMPVNEAKTTEPDSTDRIMEQIEREVAQTNQRIDDQFDLLQKELLVDEEKPGRKVQPANQPTSQSAQSPAPLSDKLISPDTTVRIPVITPGQSLEQTEQKSQALDSAQQIVSDQDTDRGRVGASDSKNELPVVPNTGVEKPAPSAAFRGGKKKPKKKNSKKKKK